MKLNVNKKSENSVFKSVEVSKAIKKKKNKRKNKKAIVVAETVTEMPIKIDSVATAPKNKEKPTKKKASKPITKTKIENSALCSKINEKSRRHQKNSPFRRVVEEEVDPELLKKMGKNAFVHKKGAESSWGAKANEDLIRTRGKSFRHEKNKKKRGSYHGGKIDMNSYSIKFDD